MPFFAVVTENCVLGVDTVLQVCSPFWDPASPACNFDEFDYIIIAVIDFQRAYHKVGNEVGIADNYSR